TWGISFDFFSWSYLDVSVRPVGLHELWIHPWMTTHDGRRVSPFGHHRITACVRLPGAFRSLPRPSSPLRAYASPVRPCTLDRNFLAGIPLPRPFAGTARGTPASISVLFSHPFFQLPFSHTWLTLSKEPPEGPFGPPSRPSGCSCLSLDPSITYTTLNP